MKFAERTRDGREVWATKRTRKTVAKRDRAGKLAARAYGMHLLRKHHGWLLEDLADAFGISVSQAGRTLASVNETIEAMAM